MSIGKQNTTFPDTLRTFERNTDAFKTTESLFMTPSDFIWTPAQFEDADWWYDNLGINFFPLHGITQFVPEDTPSEIIESIQDFKYKTNNGKYAQRIKYDWSLDYHKLINEMSGSKVNLVYASGRHLRAKLLDSGNISGFPIATFELEKILFHTDDSAGDSELFLEWLDSNDLNVSGYEVEVDWQPKKMDRLVLNLNLTFAATSITMYVRYLNENVLGISASDITITDQKNGNITFGVFVPGNGIYQLGGFSNTLTHACIYIQSTLYIGAKKFTYKFVVEVINNMIFADGNNAVLSDGNNMVLAKN